MSSTSDRDETPPDAPGKEDGHGSEGSQTVVVPPQTDPAPAAEMPLPIQSKKRSYQGQQDLRNDPEVMKHLEDALVAGNYYEDAAIAAGIGPRTFDRWRADGARAKKGTTAWRTWRMIKEAEQRAMHRNLMVIQQASKRSWQAAAWWMERKYPEKWGRREFVRSEVSGPNGGPVKTEVFETPTPPCPVSEAEMKEALKRQYERAFNIPHADERVDSAGSDAGSGTPAGDGTSGPHASDADRADPSGAQTPPRARGSA